MASESQASAEQLPPAGGVSEHPSGGIQEVQGESERISDVLEQGSLSEPSIASRCCLANCVSCLKYPRHHEGTYARGVALERRPCPIEYISTHKQLSLTSTPPAGLEAEGVQVDEVSVALVKLLSLLLTGERRVGCDISAVADAICWVREMRGRGEGKVKRMGLACHPLSIAHSPNQPRQYACNKGENRATSACSMQSGLSLVTTIPSKHMGTKRPAIHSLLTHLTCNGLSGACCRVAGTLAAGVAHILQI